MSFTLPVGLTRKDVVLGVFSPLLSTIIGGVTVYIATVSFQNGVAERQKAIEAFRSQSTSTFEAITSTYVRHMLDEKKPNNQITDQLSSNLFAQQQAIGAVAKYLPPVDSRLAKEYTDEISELLRVIPKTTSVDTMRPFWEDVSRVLVLRNEVLSKLPA